MSPENKDPAEIVRLAKKLNELRAQGNFLICKSLELNNWALYPTVLKKYLFQRMWRALFTALGIWKFFPVQFLYALFVMCLYLVCTEIFVYSQDPVKTGKFRMKVDLWLVGLSAFLFAMSFWWTV